MDDLGFHPKPQHGFTSPHPSFAINVAGEAKAMRESKGRKLIGGGAEASLCAPYRYLVFWRERHKLSHVSTGSAGFCMEELASEFKALSHAGR